MKKKIHSESEINQQLQHAAKKKHYISSLISDCPK